MTSKRQCFYVDATMNPDGEGFIPALVTEDERGYAPMGRPGPGAGIDRPSPWRWGDTIEQAKAACERVNRERFGIEPDEALKIVLSSMAAGRV
jgi:hypothetical protein